MQYKEFKELLIESHEKIAAKNLRKKSVIKKQFEKKHWCNIISDFEESKYKKNIESLILPEIKLILPFTRYPISIGLESIELSLYTQNNTHKYNIQEELLDFFNKDYINLFYNQIKNSKNCLYLNLKTMALNNGFDEEIKKEILLSENIKFDSILWFRRNINNLVYDKEDNSNNQKLAKIELLKKYNLQ